MKTFLSLLIVLGVCANSAFGVKELFAKHLWNKFKDEHGKQYEESVEAFRFSIFKKNTDLIEKHNQEFSRGLHTYTLGINYFADWTVEEFRSKMLGTRFNITRSKNASLSTFVRLPKHVQLAESVDWREEGAVTPVKNQGQCGSCWAFSTTGSLEGAHFRATGKLVSLSEQQLVDCSARFHNNGCDGGLMDNAFEYVKSVGGLDTEDSYPYHAKQGKCHFKKEEVGCTCSGFVDVDSGDEKALEEAVGTVGPVSVAIDVTEEHFMLYKDGVFVDESCSNGEDSLNHGVLVVGYGSEVVKDKNMEYWIVKNSWGTTWGEKGFIRMARNMDNMCGIATAASYPLVKDTKSF